MKPQTQWNILAVVVVIGFYLCGGGCIGLGLKGQKADTSQIVVGSALVAIPTITLCIFLVHYLLGYHPAAKAKQERERHEGHLRSLKRALSPPQDGDHPAVPASWTSVVELPQVQEHLGEKEATFKHTPRHGEAIFIATCFFIGGAVLLIVAIFVLATRPNAGILIVILVVISLLVMAGSVLGLVFVIQRKANDLRVLIYEKGLVRVDRGLFIVFLWDDLLELYQVIVDAYVYGVVHKAQEYGFGLYRCDGEVLHIYEGVNVMDVGPLSDILQSKVADRVFPRVRAQFKAGDDIVFGPLTVNRAGVSDGSEKIPWTEVEAIRIADGVVTIKRAGKWFSWAKVEARDIPNLYVFLILADKIIGVNR